MLADRSGEPGKDRPDGPRIASLVKTSRSPADSVLPAVCHPSRKWPARPARKSVFFATLQQKSVGVERGRPVARMITLQNYGAAEACRARSPCASVLPDASFSIFRECRGAWLYTKKSPPVLGLPHKAKKGAFRSFPRESLIDIQTLRTPTHAVAWPIWTSRTVCQAVSSRAEKCTKM